MFLVGNEHDYVLTVPVRADVLNDAVREGLDSLGFRPIGDDEAVWVRLSQRIWRSLGTTLKAAVLALPWERQRVAVRLEVLWRDEYTDDDDSWIGREAPYGWNRETWVIAERGRRV